MKDLQLGGIHHVTAITSSAPKIYDFFTDILGMRLVKKNVNQDDLTTYHLFFADDRGNPGTDMTFFDFKGIGQHVEGNEDISKTSFRVDTHEALEYWVKRLDHFEVKHSGIKKRFGREFLDFVDFDDQHYTIVSDEGVAGVAPGEPWYKGPVPDEYAIRGLGPIFLTVSDEELMNTILVDLMKMKRVQKEESLILYEMGDGGNGGSVIVGVSDIDTVAMQGYGGVHHVAFRVKDREELNQWTQFFNQLQIPNSGYVDRFYFKSLYIRLYPNILFEIATDGPGFIDDQESYEVLGETLTLPPHLRNRREYVEKHLKTFDSVRSTKSYEKEYF